MSNNPNNVGNPIIKGTKEKVDKILSEDNKRRLVIKTGGAQAYRRQLKTAEDFAKGLRTFIMNNQESTEQMHQDIHKAVLGNILTDFQSEMAEIFMIFQSEMNKSIQLLSEQQKEFQKYMTAVRSLMKVFNISAGVSQKGGLNDQINQILEDNK